MYFPAPDETLWVGVLRLSLRIPGARTIKDRRRVVNGMRDRLQTRFRVSFADVGHLDASDRAIVAISVVGNESRQLQSRLDTVFADIESSSEALIEGRNTELIRLGTHTEGAR